MGTTRRVITVSNIQRQRVENQDFVLKTRPNETIGSPFQTSSALRTRWWQVRQEFPSKHNRAAELSERETEKTDNLHVLWNTATYYHCNLRKGEETASLTLKKIKTTSEEQGKLSFWNID